MTAAAIAPLRAGPARPPAGPAVSRFEPPTAFDPAEVPALNRLSRRRAPFRAAVEGLTLELGPVTAAGPEAIAAPAEALDLTWTVGDLEVVATLPLGTVEQLVAAMQPDLIDLPDEPALSLLIELALAPLLDKSEARLDRSCVLVETRPGARGAERGMRALAAAGSLGGVAFTALVRAGSADPLASADLLDLLTRLREAGPSPTRWPGEAPFPILVTVRAGALALPLRGLAGLRPGDVLIPDAFPLARGEVVIMLGARHGATAKIEAGQARLQSPLRRVASSEEASPMQTDAAPRPAGDTAAELDDIDVALVFELGRQSIEVGELRSITPGYVFALGRDPNGPIDILANGRRVGRGEIVKVGDQLGVRVVRIFGEGG